MAVPMLKETVIRRAVPTMGSPEVLTLVVIFIVWATDKYVGAGCFSNDGKKK